MRQIEIRVIKQVEGFGVEREACAFPDREAAGERQIEGEQSRSFENIPARRTEVIARRNGERGGIEPALGSGMIQTRIAQQVRAVRAEDAAGVSGVAVIGAEYRREGLARLGNSDAAHFGIAGPPGAARYMKNVRRGEAVPHVVARERALGAVIAAVLWKILVG